MTHPRGSNIWQSTAIRSHPGDRSMETRSGLPLNIADTVDRTQISVADDTINKYEYLKM